MIAHINNNFTVQPQTAQPQRNMKKFIVSTILALAALLWLNGCVAAIGNRDAHPAAAL